MRRSEFGGELLRHCVLVLVSVAIALAIGAPLGVFTARRPEAGRGIFGALNLLQTIPSVALFGLLLAPLSALGIGGIGPVPAIIALVFYALLPVVRNTHAGITGVDPAVIDAASGMGLTRRQILWRIEMPLGLPVFLAGVRIVTVQAIGLAAVAALIGAGGLGTFIFQGIGQYAIDLVLLGAIPTILLGARGGFPARAAGCRCRKDTAMIELAGVTKRYGARMVVDNVSLKIDKGAFCVVVGPSGSGKSTTLRMINRLIEPSSGTITLDGTDVRSLPVESLRRRIGYAIQSVGLFPHWTIADNIATVPRLLKWPEDRVQSRTDELLKLFQLDTATTRPKYPHQLSGGQQQRIGVARALAADPEVLLMDEPFGALDPITREALRIEIARIHKTTGKTILFVTHDIDEALQLADVIAIMRDGKLVQFGAPLDLLTKPADDFVRDFMGGSALGLKLLSLRQVGDHVDAAAAPGEPIKPDTSFADALSQMVLRHTDRLPVADASGKPAGSIGLGDLVA